VHRIAAVRWLRAATAALVALMLSAGLAGVVLAQRPPERVGTPTRVATSESLDVLAFSRADGALAVAAEDGSALLQVSSPRGGEVVSHSWSPDGRRIAFSRCRGRNCSEGSVYVVSAGGTGERLVVSRAGSAVWLADGKHLLVGRSDKPGHWIVAASNGSRRRFTAPRLAAAPGSPRLSPDGRWLIHLTLPYGRVIPNPYAPHHARARNWLLITDLANGRSRRVSNERGWYSIGTAPWAPDGTRFTFTGRAFLQAPGGKLHVAAPSSSGSKIVGSGAREGGAWSPDSKRIAFNFDGQCKISVVSVDASSAARVLPFAGCLPTWRPSR
jgi:Tol biopolymer transport system component